MYVLIVEDDPVQFEFIEESLIGDSKFGRVNIDRISSESEFVNRFETIATNRPDVVIMDIMLKWTDPSEDMVIPPDVAAETYRGGMRCSNKLASDPRTKGIPIIIYSVLDEEDLENDLNLLPNVRYILKDFNSQKILSTIRSLLR